MIKWLKVMNELMTDYKIRVSQYVNMWMNTHGWGKESEYKVNEHVVDKIYSELFKINFPEEKVIQILRFVGTSAQRKGQMGLVHSG